MLNLYTNRNEKEDFFANVFIDYGKNRLVRIAVPFLTDWHIIKQLVDNGCIVQLIIRLCYVTSATALNEILALKGVEVRFFSSENFHTKLYIFGNDIAFVGSSNLTDHGLRSNQEVNVGIDSEDSRFDELIELFSDYWEAARPLDEAKVRACFDLETELKNNDINKANDAYKKLFGSAGFDNISREKRKLTQDEIESDQLTKEYASFLYQFEIVDKIYSSYGRRKLPEARMPLKIEIDNFLSWIRDTKIRDVVNPLTNPMKRQALERRIRDHIEEYLDSKNMQVLPFLEKLDREVYPKFQKNFGTKDRIQQLSRQELGDTLLGINAFRTRRRSPENLVKTFFEQNDESRIRNTLSYLLHGPDNFKTRIFRCIRDNESYRLNEFGRSCVRELFGWVNSDDIPICNERTLKSMEYLGFRGLN